MINYAYGILKGNASLSENFNGFRYSDAVPTASQLSSLKELYTVDLAQLPLALDFYLKLLRSSSNWSHFEKNYDPQNTYRIAVVNTSGLLDRALSLDMPKILTTWDDNHSPKAAVYKYSAYDPFLYRVSAKIFNILAQHPNFA